ncbi:MAG: DUF2284 domain-containing protein [Desulfobacteraceae bacterium]|nr:DUF2284 domain-containing protein [Desulfobacteraceae bacterium]
MERKTTVLCETDEIKGGLVREALELGATAAAVISADQIVVDESLADKCRNPKCINYGLSKSCPPHVAGPSAFKELLETVSRAIVFKIEVPSEVLYSGQNLELFQLLHETAAGIEQAAIRMGFSGARAYAGNSCKKVFCADYLECRALGEDGQCRNPDRARASMSGFGVNVAKLYAAAGWERKGVTHETDSGSIRMDSICGLVLIC